MELQELLTKITAELAVQRVNAAIDVAISFGQIDGEHHKAWVIDQMVRALAGDAYDQLIAESNAGEDGPETYTWDTGVAP